MSTLIFMPSAEDKIDKMVKHRAEYESREEIYQQFEDIILENMLKYSQVKVLNIPTIGAGLLEFGIDGRFIT